MEPLDRLALEDRLDTYDRAVERGDGYDRFCSASPWVVAAHRHLSPPRELWSGEAEGGFWALARREHEGLAALEPLEAMWLFGSSLVGPRPDETLAACLASLEARADEWSVLVLSGIYPEGPLRRALARRLPRSWVVGHVARRVRRVASLEGGLDAFMGRRSANLRRTVRRAERRARVAGLEVVVPTGSPTEVVSRLLAIEARSWKGREGVGVDRPPLADFYHALVSRLASRRALRALVARLGGRDVAYVVGGVCGRRYRGLQISFDADLSSWSLGSLLQYRQLEMLCRDGTVDEYDLGMEMPYKARWAERTESSDTVAIRRW